MSWPAGLGAAYAALKGTVTTEDTAVTGNAPRSFEEASGMEDVGVPAREEASGNASPLGSCGGGESGTDEVGFNEVEAQTPKYKMLVEEDVTAIAVQGMREMVLESISKYGPGVFLPGCGSPKIIYDGADSTLDRPDYNDAGPSAGKGGYSPFRSKAGGGVSKEEKVGHVEGVVEADDEVSFPGGAVAQEKKVRGSGGGYAKINRRATAANVPLSLAETPSRLQRDTVASKGFNGAPTSGGGCEAVVSAAGGTSSAPGTPDKLSSFELASNVSAVPADV